MKNKILKLAKRLETFKLEDIESITGEGIEDILQELVEGGQLNLVGEIYPCRFVSSFIHRKKLR